MHCKLTILFFLLLSCSSNKKINSSGNSRNKKFHFLPVQISYTGIALEDSLKDFIAHCFQSKNIDVIDNEYSELLIRSEMHRAGQLITATEPEDRMKQLERNQQYVFSNLEINFKQDKDGQQIDMGWRVVPQPVNFGNMIKGNWKYLKDHKISNSPPQDQLRILCDSIIYSRTLY